MEGYRFDGFAIDTARREIRHHGRIIPVDRQVFDVIAHLAAHADRVVPRTELLDAVWGDRFVSDSALSTRIKTARRALGDNGSEQRRILTVRGVGYRLVLDDPRATPTARADPAVGSSGDHDAGADDLAGTSTVPVDQLVGRDGELAATERLIEAGRAATLVGPGGVGKTRLALEVVRRAGDRFPDGVCVVELASVSTDTGVVAATAHAMGLRVARDEGALPAIARALRDRRVLLVLDNCEHVPVGALELSAMLGRDCPTVVVLATSRSPIGHGGEHLVPVPPLPTRPDPVPGGTTSAETLFVRRLAGLAPGVAPDPVLVASICHRLDGIPLALELAAGRARALGLEGLHARLDEALGLLGAVRLDPRHRTLRDTIGWSVDLLDDVSRSVLARAAVFAGSFTLAAAERVLADEEVPPATIAPRLAELVDASLVQVTVDGAGRRRFRLLETIRQFAREIADADDLTAVERRAIGHAVDTATRIGAELLTSSDPAHWFDVAAAELPNLRDAARLALDRGDLDAVLALAWSLREWSYLSVTEDPVTWAGWLVDRLAADDLRLPRALSLTAYQAASRGARDELIGELERVAVVAPDEPGIVRALSLLYWFAGRTEDADRACRRLVEMWTGRDDPALAAYSLALWSMVLDAIDRPAALRLADEVLAVAAELESPVLRASGLIPRIGALAHDDLPVALAEVDELVATCRSSGSRWHTATALRIRSHVLSRAGRLDEADRSFLDSLDANGFADRGEFFWYTILNLIEHLLRRGRDADAGLALGAYERSPAAIHDGLAARTIDRLGARLVERLGDEAADRVRAEADELAPAALLERLRTALTGGAARSPAQDGEAVSEP